MPHIPLAYAALFALAIWLLYVTIEVAKHVQAWPF